MAIHLHSKLLARVARQLLSPLGVIQRGRSRLWFADHGWWLCVIEFQPSGWDKGSYLNVGAMWLWWENDYFSFDEGHRAEAFVTFDDEEQFTREAERLARRAEQELERYRALFPSVRAVADYYRSRPPEGFREKFHAAVACGLSGYKDDARILFQQYAAIQDDRDWVREAVNVAQGLQTRLDDETGFRSHIAEVVRRTRQLLRLESIEEIDFDDSNPRADQ